jgi:hypothetical protein
VTSGLQKGLLLRAEVAADEDRVILVGPSLNQTSLQTLQDTAGYSEQQEVGSENSVLVLDQNC